MATTVSETYELQIELKSVDDQYKRILRVLNPLDDLTREQVATALAPALTAQTAGGESVPFFYDDANPQAGLTVLGTVQIVEIRKSVTDVQ